MTASTEIARLEAELKDYQEQLEVVKSSLDAGTCSDELVTLKSEIEQFIELQTAAIEELRPKAEQEHAVQKAKEEVSNKPIYPPKSDKWSWEDHPAFKRTVNNSNAAGISSLGTDDDVNNLTINSTHTFHINDEVLARWPTGEKHFAPARITAITGSSTNPVYTVSFKADNSSLTLRSADLKIRPDSRKRKLDESTSAMHHHHPYGSTVISAAANIRRILSNGQGVPSTRNGSDSINTDSSDAFTGNRSMKQPRKLKNNRELETEKCKWLEFSQKSKWAKKTGKKDSIFRTGEGVNARVGFTGSGQTMRKDPARTRHIYDINEDE